MEENLPPGFRFHPTDEELITYYLLRKVSDTAFTSKAVAVVDLNKSEPWDLPGKGCMGEKEWYFFSLKDRKYPTGLRTNRATESGYWKTTGKDKEIFGGGVLIGMKKTLVFYMGRAPRGEKSNWVMHEYRLQPYTSSKEEWVICRVFEKSSAPKKAQQTSSSQPSQESPNSMDMVNEFGDVDIPNLNNTIAGQTYNVNSNLNLTMNLASASVNSLLLKALHLRNTYQQTEAAATNHFPTHAPQGFSPNTTPNLTAASSKALQSYCVSQQEQPFNMDSIW
ncbi:hypothetical protein VNO78_10089 [Psophocarpus tetragonolobus]|uniref:NAC domain-containing protein n=1 Tax=Psophocarpus tetragonolobus TaxID=3891 RepID=A0AAN9SJ95_PSOTE